MLCGIRIRVVGFDRIPQGAAIIAPNHISFLDPPLVCIALQHHSAHFMARKSLFDTAIGWGLRLGHGIPVERGQADLKALRGVMQALKAGRKVVIFPEGTRSITGELQEFKLGPMICAQRTGAPIVPVCVHGHEELWPIGKKWPRLWGRCTVAFGEPIHPDTFEDSREGALAMSQELRERMLRLKESLGGE